MYKAVYKIQDGCIDVENSKLFTPFVKCYWLHSAVLTINGVSYEEDIDFYFEDHYTCLNSGFDLSECSVILDLNYFYIKRDENEILGFLIDGTYQDKSRSKEIVSRHYAEGQFSLDNGLYKNAVLNFGTVVEGLLNKDFGGKGFVALINEYRGMADKEDMHFIRKLRNKVHPNQIHKINDVGRRDAVEARNKLEVILRTING